MIITDLKTAEPKYNLVLADPPWQQKRGDSKRVRINSSGKPLDYPVLPLSEIKKHLMLADGLCRSSSGGAILFLWTIDKYLIQAQQMAESMGYKLHARMIWDKINGIPAAFTIRYGHEYLLYMYKGKLLPIAKEERGKIHSVFHEMPKKHSQKPEIAYQIIERLYPDLNKLELYARNTRPGWDSWGNELVGQNE